MVGPILPIYYRNTDIDVGYSALGIFPFYFGSSSPKGRTLLTPLFGRFESYNVSRHYWVFPNITYTRDVGGWETDIHPLVYLGRDKDFVAHGPRARVLGLREPEGPHDDRLPAVLALRGLARRHGHPGRRQHALSREARARAAPTGSSTSCRCSPTGRARPATGGTCSSASPATTATDRPRRSRRSGSRSRSPAAATATPPRAEPSARQHGAEGTDGKRCVLVRRRVADRDGEHHAWRQRHRHRQQHWRRLHRASAARRHRSRR